MGPSRYRTLSQTFDNIDYSSDDDFDIPISYQLSLAAEESKENAFWPVHRHASFFLSAIVTASCILAIVFPLATIVAYIVPKLPDAKHGSIGRRSSQGNIATLSWPSACWALTAIGINTMSQPFGKVLGLPTQYSFVLRSSPVICIADTLAMLLDVACYGFGTRSILDGIGLAVRSRFADIQADGDGSFSTLRKNTVFRVLLFFLGALPQALKLYAARGIPCTQTLGTIYLTSFLLSEIASLIASRSQVERAPTNQSTGIYARYRNPAVLTTLAVSVGLVYALFSAAIFVIIRDYWDIAGWPLILCACLFNILYISSIVSSKRELLILCSGPLVSVSGVSLSSASSYALITLSISVQPMGWLLSSDRQSAAFLSIVTVITMMITSVSFYRLTRDISSKYLKYVHFELSGYYFLLHLTTIFLAYAFLYDPASTMKPTWTDALG